MKDALVANTLETHGHNISKQFEFIGIQIFNKDPNIYETHVHNFYDTTKRKKLVSI